MTDRPHHDRPTPNPAPGEPRPARFRSCRGHDRPGAPEGEGLDTRLVTLAVIIGAHGVAGEVRLKSFAGDLANYRSFNGGKLTLKSLRAGNNGAIARFAEIVDRNAAEAMRGTELAVARSELPPLGDGEYYHADLIGLRVVDDAGGEVGEVVAIENFGAGDVIEIERPPSEDGKRGKRFMVPMRAEAVPEWNAERLVVAAGYVEA